MTVQTLATSACRKMLGRRPGRLGGLPWRHQRPAPEYMRPSRWRQKNQCCRAAGADNKQRRAMPSRSRFGWSMLGTRLLATSVMSDVSLSSSHYFSAGITRARRASAVLGCRSKTTANKLHFATAGTWTPTYNNAS